MHLTPDLLLRAYAIGIFPMAEGRAHKELHWIDPELRGILPLDNFRMPRKLKSRVRRGDFQVTCDSEFAQVIRACAEPAANRPDTWINPAIEKLYTELHESGFAHSLECRRDGELVGGLYGVSLGAAFFGESMFSREADASKVALAHLVARLRKGGFRLLDTQFATPHLSRFGVVEIGREEYRSHLAKAITTQARFPTELTAEELKAFLGTVG
ncbi:MAG: leucyl/phenylalanyl-tRNA--protein transferase [Kiloniellales bacterium]|jgi:leucyl/phenylalanyl-tRNA--protein transferase